MNKNRILIRISTLRLKSKLKKLQTRVETVTPRTKVNGVGLLADFQLLFRIRWVSHKAGSAGQLFRILASANQDNIIHNYTHGGLLDMNWNI